MTPVRCVAGVLLPPAHPTPDIEVASWHHETQTFRVHRQQSRRIQAFIDAGLVDEITISLIPVLIGEGIPRFGPLTSDVRLRHVSTRSFPSGLVQVKYRTLE